MIGFNFGRQCHRELLINLRQPRLILNAILFFIMMMVFFPLSMPANPLVIRQIAPGLIWMAALLAMMLASERLFQQDYEEGIIEQWLVSGESITVLVGAKLFIHWLVIIIPLLLCSPLLAMLFGFSLREISVLIASLIVGTPTLLSLCGLAAAFSAGMQQKGLFMALIVLPLTIPVIIFGSSILNRSMVGVSGNLAILSALSLIAASFLPFAIAAIIRISLAD